MLKQAAATIFLAKEFENKIKVTIWNVKTSLFCTALRTTLKVVSLK